MDNVIILNEEQFQDAIYKAVSRCLDERNIDMTTNSSSEDVFYSRDELCELLHIRIPYIMAYREEWLAEKPESRSQELVFQARG